MENLQSTSSDNVPTGGDLDSLLDALRALDEASGLEPLADFGNINQADLLAINPRMPHLRHLPTQTSLTSQSTLPASPWLTWPT